MNTTKRTKQIIFITALISVLTIIGFVLMQALMPKPVIPKTSPIINKGIYVTPQAITYYKETDSIKIPIVESGLTFPTNANELKRLKDQLTQIDVDSLYRIQNDTVFLNQLFTILGFSKTTPYLDYLLVYGRDSSFSVFTKNVLLTTFLKASAQEKLAQNQVLTIEEGRFKTVSQLPPSPKAVGISATDIGILMLVGLLTLFLIWFYRNDSKNVPAIIQQPTATTPKIQPLLAKYPLDNVTKSQELEANLIQVVTEIFNQPKGNPKEQTIVENYFKDLLNQLTSIQPPVGKQTELGGMVTQLKKEIERLITTANSETVPKITELAKHNKTLAQEVKKQFKASQTKFSNEFGQLSEQVKQLQGNMQLNLENDNLKAKLKRIKEGLQQTDLQKMIVALEGIYGQDSPVAQNFKQLIAQTRGIEDIVAKYTNTDKIIRQLVINANGYSANDDLKNRLHALYQRDKQYQKLQQLANTQKSIATAVEDCLDKIEQTNTYWQGITDLVQLFKADADNRFDYLQDLAEIVESHSDVIKTSIQQIGKNNSTDNQVRIIQATDTLLALIADLSELENWNIPKPYYAMLPNVILTNSIYRKIEMGIENETNDDVLQAEVRETLQMFDHALPQYRDLIEKAEQTRFTPLLTIYKEFLFLNQNGSKHQYLTKLYERHRNWMEQLDNFEDAQSLKSTEKVFFFKTLLHIALHIHDFLNHHYEWEDYRRDKERELVNMDLILKDSVSNITRLKQKEYEVYAPTKAPKHVQVIVNIIKDLGITDLEDVLVKGFYVKPSFLR